MPRREDLKFTEENKLILRVLCLDFVLFAGHCGTLSPARKRRGKKKKEKRKKKKKQILDSNRPKKN